VEVLREKGVVCVCVCVCVGWGGVERKRMISGVLMRTMTI